MSGFNFVAVYCPACDNKIHFHSKSGTCRGVEYDIYNLPKGELKGILGKKKKCKICGGVVRVGESKRTRKDFSHLVQKGDKNEN